MRAFFALCVAGCVLFTLVPASPVAVADDDERRIELSDVPADIRDAAMKAVEGLKLTGAVIEVERGRTIYELEGTADGRRYEIEVSEEGEVLEVEQEDDDEDDDDNYDDHDDD